MTTLRNRLRDGALDVTLPPWPGDPYARRNRLFAVRYDPDGYAGTYKPTLHVGIGRPGRYCTPDRTRGLFLRWFTLRLPHVSWKLAWRLRAVGGFRAYQVVKRIYRQERAS